MQIPAIKNYDCCSGGKKKDTSFGAIRIKGGNRLLREAVLKDYSIVELADTAEKRFNKDIVVKFKKKTSNMWGDLYRVTVSADNGPIGNFFSKHVMKNFIDLTDYHRPQTLDGYCTLGLIHRLNISTESALKRLGLK